MFLAILRDASLRSAPQDEGRLFAPVAFRVPIRHHPRRTDSPHQGVRTMNITISHLQPVVALVAGILILIMPRLLNYIVAIYLIIVGIIGLGIIK
jgi:DUF3096 family protein